jgi:hypothetical protein
MVWSISFGVGMTILGLAQRANAKALRRSTAKTCEDLMLEFPRQFSVADGVNDTCAAGQVKDSFQCQVASIGYDAAFATCNAIGARLCTFDEVDRGATRGLGCKGLYAEDSYCWTSDDTHSADNSCPEGEAFATRCRHFNGGQHQADTQGDKFCRRKVEPGSLACCASGGLEMIAMIADVPGNQGRVTDPAVCNAITCAYNCHEQPGCGWASPHQQCQTGQKTVDREMLDGDCKHITPEQRATLNLNRICEKYTCGRECAEEEGCGWSTPLGKCKPGRETAPSEMYLGNCDGDDSGVNRVLDDEAEARVECEKFTCGYTCSKKKQCGWSSKKKQMRSWPVYAEG